MLFLCVSGAQAQNTLHVAAGELSVPFGSAPGSLLTVGDYLIFVDKEHPESSFALSRADVQDLTVSERVAQIRSVTPVRDRNGERTQINIKLGDDSEGRVLTEWFGSPVRRTSESSAKIPDTVSASGPEARNSNSTSYEARHDHRLLGSSRGRLIITDKSLSYESIDNLSDSRQWQFTDIKELTLSNPYEIHIIPFDGSEYKLALHGTGMDKAVFKSLVDRVTASRVTRDGATPKH
jgi:hypothetical protein